MDEAHLYRQIAESLRQEILAGAYQPGDKLPPLRKLAARWDCTVGTIQHAYQELARQGLLTSRAGQGTRVVDRLPLAVQGETPLRRAVLVHRAESFLLESLSTGYSLAEVESAVHQAMDRWRVAELQDPLPEARLVRFAGSHDLALIWLAGIFAEIVPGGNLQLRFSGSLAGLVALAGGQAEIAGAHLWDEESDTYNVPFVRRFFPGQRVALVMLAQRRLGLILPAGNPAGLQGLADLARPGLRFVNRQSGSGTRVWLDASLRRAGITAEAIVGYENAHMTHSAVAQAVAQGQADVGLGLEAAAISYGLDFCLLAHERYDLVIPEAALQRSEVQQLVEALSRPDIKAGIQAMGGYDVEQTGRLDWIA